MSHIIDEHRQYLGDRTRLDAFERAIRQAVRPGDVVADLACGTGILGLLACRAGASRVYAIDAGPVLDLARQLARANGVADRIHHVAGHSSHVTLPEAVDVILCDQVGRFGFDAGVVEVMRDGRRWLRPEGRVIPQSVDVCVAGIENDRLHAEVEFWRARPAGFEMSLVRRFAVNCVRRVGLEPAGLLTGGARILTYDMTRAEDDVRHGAVTLVARRAGVLHGLAGWSEAELAAGVSITNAPDAEARIDRGQVFLPLDVPVSLAEGDAIDVSLTVRSAELLVNWRVRCVHGGDVVADFDQSTLRGLLLTREELAVTRTEATPVLNEWGGALLTVLDLCDGRRTRGAIESATFDRHRDLFTTPEQAAEYVAEVVVRYADPRSGG
jgi:protein arginine N-methyltransferase 1